MTAQHSTPAVPQLGELEGKAYQDAVVDAALAWAVRVAEPAYVHQYVLRHIAGEMVKRRVAGDSVRAELCADLLRQRGVDSRDATLQREAERLAGLRHTAPRSKKQKVSEVGRRR